MKIQDRNNSTKYIALFFGAFLLTGLASPSFFNSQLFAQQLASSTSSNLTNHLDQPTRLPTKNKKKGMADWLIFNFGGYGFNISVPANFNQRATPNKRPHDIQLIFDSVVPEISWFTVSIAQPLKTGIFDESIDSALLEIIMIEKKARGIDKIDYKFRDFSGARAIEHNFQYLEGNLLLTYQGVSFAKDGGYLRLLARYPSRFAKHGAEQYERFLNSFENVPVKFQPAHARFNIDDIGLSFYPPRDWHVQKFNVPYKGAVLTHLTRSIRVFTVNNVNYQCEQFLSDKKKNFKIDSTKEITLDSKQYLEVTTREYLPKHKVTLRTVDYCANSPLGAIIVSPIIEDEHFEKWKKVAHGVTTSVKF